jgi:transposase-like protein
MARKGDSEEFKVAAAKLVREQGYTVRRAAQSLGVDPGSIRGWLRRYVPEPAARPRALRPRNSGARTPAAGRRIAGSSSGAKS